MLSSLDLSHLVDVLHGEDIRSLQYQLKNGRPYILQYLKSKGVSNLVERQRLTNGLSRLARTGQASPPPKPTGPAPWDGVIVSDGSECISLEMMASKKNMADTMQHQLGSDRAADAEALAAAGLHDAAALAAAGLLPPWKRAAAVTLLSNGGTRGHPWSERTYSSPKAVDTRQLVVDPVDLPLAYRAPPNADSPPPLRPGGAVLILSPDRAMLWQSPPAALHILPAVMGATLPPHEWVEMQSKARQVRQMCFGGAPMQVEIVPCRTRGGGGTVEPSRRVCGAMWCCTDIARDIHASNTVLHQAVSMPSRGGRS